MARQARRAGHTDPVPVVTATATIRPRERPKDRKQQIAGHAARMFVERGFHAVRMEDIAAASGITVRALYRHYAHKQALLSHVVGTGQATYLAAFEAAGAPWPGPDCLEGLLRSIIEGVLDTRGMAVLWQRESRYLDAEDRALVLRRLFDLAVRLTEQIGRQPGRATTGVEPGPEFTAWAVLGALAGPGQHRVALPRRELGAVLGSVARAVLAVPPPAGPPAPTDHPHPVQGRMASRREQLLGVAAAAFHRDGYPAVGIDDIGGEAGVVGAALYRYFPAKLDVLATLCRRFDEWSTLETTRALRAGGTPRQVLRGLVEGYVRLALEAPDLMAVGLGEVLHLPAEFADPLLRNHGDRVAEWLDRLRSVRPGLPEPTARVLVVSAMALVENTAQVRRVSRRHGVAGPLADAATAVLLAPVG